jgi:hypothetical protein
MANDPQGPERRAHPRAKVRVPARVRTEVGVLDAETVDLSEGGVLLNSNELPTAQEVWIDLELADLGWSSFRGEVVRREQANGVSRFAARLAEEALEGREALRAFLASL